MVGGIYVSAGIIEALSETNNVDLPGEESRPGQPGAHRIDFRSKYIAQKIMMSSDQLTRKMFAGAMDSIWGTFGNRSL